MTAYATDATRPERWAAFEAAEAALAELPGAVGAVSDEELATLVRVLDELATRARAAQLALAEEARTRGVVARSQAAGVRGWLRAHAPSTALTGEAGVLARLIEGWSRAEAAPVRAAVLQGRLAPRVAMTVLEEFDKLEPRLADMARPDVMTHLVEVGAQCGSRAVRDLRSAVLARWGAVGELDAVAESNRRSIELTPFWPVSAGLWESRLVVDESGRAVIEAAIGPLSRPAPVRGPGGELLEADPRPLARRRGEALVEVCRRASGLSSSTPSGLKAALFVAITAEELQQRTGCGVTVGAFGAGGYLAPEDVRRIGCDAGVIRVLLDARGEVLDVGRTERLFTTGMVKALWWRDRHCSFPGCDAPAHWCDAHHLWHWADGGPTATHNAALLCGRHHTVVHAQRLHGQVRDGEVTWDRTPGSYDRWLDGHRTVTGELRGRHPA